MYISPRWSFSFLVFDVTSIINLFMIFLPLGIFWNISIHFCLFYWDVFQCLVFLNIFASTTCYPKFLDMPNLRCANSLLVFFLSSTYVATKKPEELTNNSLVVCSLNLILVNLIVIVLSCKHPKYFHPSLSCNRNPTSCICICTVATVPTWQTKAKGSCNS